jgi:hypothetical protein
MTTKAKDERAQLIGRLRSMKAGAAARATGGLRFFPASSGAGDRVRKISAISTLTLGGISH